MYKAVIFDVDGTLVDTEKAIINSLKRMVEEELGKKYEYEELLFILGIPSIDGLLKLGIKDMETARRKWGEYYREHAHGVRVFPGIEEMLSELKALNIVTGIVTSKSRRQFDRDFIPLGISGYFDYSICTDDTEKHKPEPEPILKFLEISGIKASESIYLGDTVYDMQCACGAGVDFGLVLWGAHDSAVFDRCRYKFIEPKEILNHIAL